MKLTNAITKKGQPFKVPNCSRDELPEFLKSLGFKVGAEIGVFKGDYLEKFCQAGFRMYGIDPWPKRNWMFQKTRSRFRNNKNCTLIRKTSMEAFAEFPSRSLDFIYIDGDHRFPFVAEDLYYWYWRVKRGGIIAGHDYLDIRPGSQDRTLQIKSVVDAFVKSFNIGNFYIFGGPKRGVKETQTDNALSFMFFKNW